jgi:hypothetical protein
LGIVRQGPGSDTTIDSAEKTLLPKMVPKFSAHNCFTIDFLNTVNDFYHRTAAHVFNEI